MRKSNLKPAAPEQLVPAPEKQWAAAYDRGFKAGYELAIEHSRPREPATLGVQSRVDEKDGWQPMTSAPVSTPVVIDPGDDGSPTRVCQYHYAHGWLCVDNLGNAGTFGYGVIHNPKRWRPVSEAWHTSQDKRYD